MTNSLSSDRPLARANLGGFSMLSLLLIALLQSASIATPVRAAASKKPTTYNAASFLRISVPKEMVAGSTYPVTVEYRNTGTTTWAAGSAYHLGSLDPQDSSTWGFDRVFLPARSHPVKPGQSVRFQFIVAAPSKPGTYHFQWRMVQDEVAWFGDPSANDTVFVRPQPTPPPGLLTQRWFLGQPMVTTHVQFIDLPFNDVVLSPNGRRIAYLTSRDNAPGSPAVIRIRAANGTADDLVSDAFSQAIVTNFSPDGRSLFVNGTTRAETNASALIHAADQPDTPAPFGSTLWRVTIKTGAIIPLLPLSVDCINAQYSPSGKEILFQVIGNSDPILPLKFGTSHRYLHSIADGTYIIDSDGRHLRQLSWLSRDEVPEWAPSGNQITVLRRAGNGGPANIWFMSLSGKSIRPLLLKNIAEERLPASKFSMFWYRWLNSQMLLVDGIAAVRQGTSPLTQLWIVRSDGVMEQKVPTGEVFVGMAQNGHELLVSDKNAHLWLISLAPAE